MSAVARAARHLSRTYLPKRGATSLAYSVSNDGKLSNALSAQHIQIPTTVSADAVSLRWLAAGIDDVDFSATAKRSATGVSGTEGVAVVKDIGSNVKSLKAGDVVIPIKPGVGTWCETSVVPASTVTPISRDIRVEIAATLTASPFTAMRLLCDFATLSAGDVVVQNSGSSAVGTAIVQIANAMGLRTISFVRESMTDYAPTVERLKLMGGDVVIGESHVGSAGFKSVMNDLPKPKLGINGFSNAESCKLVMKFLAKEGTVVSYGSMMPKVGITKQLKIKHEKFVLADWLEKADRKEVETMVSELTKMMENEQLTAWLKRVPFAELPAAVARGAPIRRKLVSIMDSGEV